MGSERDKKKGDRTVANQNRSRKKKTTRMKELGEEKPLEGLGAVERRKAAHMKKSTSLVALVQPRRGTPREREGARQRVTEILSFAKVGKGEVGINQRSTAKRTRRR